MPLRRNREYPAEPVHLPVRESVEPHALVFGKLPAWPPVRPLSRALREAIPPAGSFRVCLRLPVNFCRPFVCKLDTPLIKRQNPHTFYSNCRSEEVRRPLSHCMAMASQLDLERVEASFSGART